ncbi:P-loop NTPase fold protein [Acinetobacter sp. HR7]|uniref:KAP family P-loop NTPase fold protein n=1 Tax=Acinetobacter sp. HR7 TaxID=1509403 RepID=UPI0005385DE8|nr:P-loop NTPase fold protein [Acinetobacter sp. HR7]KGT48463.1 hypothetical protein GW12_04950 [Acinetobacter sp. HR7]
MTADQLNWQKDNFENIQTAWEGDLWDRRRLGEQLERYVDRLNCGAVLALDARWGEGKTWFVRHWKKHLETTQPHKHDVIYLDAFANDYLEDPFLVIASEIAAKLDKTADKKLVHKFKKAAAVMQQGLLTLTPTLIASMISCTLTGGVIPFIRLDSESIKDKIDDAVDKVVENIGEKVTEAIQNKIDSYEEEKNSLQAFKTTLSELADSLDKPLVFIIDELDRCRPDFAIRLIERIKHFFDIPKIVFVLVMNKPQLLQSVQRYYGYDSKLNGDYFEKFIDYTIEFPKIGEDQLYEGVIKEQLYRIGELKSKADLNEFFLWILSFQASKKYNSRELVKKINQFALLRVDEIRINFVLIAIIFDKNFEISIYHLNKIVDYLFSYFGGSENMGTTKSYFVREQLFNKLNIDNSIISDMYEGVSYIETNFLTIGQQKQKEQAIKNLLFSYCISGLDDIKDFKIIWDQYIKTGLFEKS